MPRGSGTPDYVTRRQMERSLLSLEKLAGRIEAKAAKNRQLIEECVQVDDNLSEHLHQLMERIQRLEDRLLPPQYVVVESRGTNDSKSQK